MTLNIPELIAHPDKLADKLVLHELRELIAAFPYYQAVRLLYLKGLYLTHDQSFGEELRRTALYVSDRKVLFYLIEGDYYTLKPVPRKPRKAEGEDEVEADRTQVLIDAFLSGLPVEESEVPLALVGDDGLSADYTSYILREEELEEDEAEDGRPMKGQRLIDDFIRNADEKHPVGETSPAEREDATPMEDLSPIEEDESYFTETLAKIYIKQHRYAKALEIIRRLSLKYPKKNAYFADQIRFLEKLIENSDEK